MFVCLNRSEEGVTRAGQKPAKEMDGFSQNCSGLRNSVAGMTGPAEQGFRSSCLLSGMLGFSLTCFIATDPARIAAFSKPLSLGVHVPISLESL